MSNPDTLGELDPGCDPSRARWRLFGPFSGRNLVQSSNVAAVTGALMRSYPDIVHSIVMVIESDEEDVRWVAIHQDAGDVIATAAGLMACIHEYDVLDRIHLEQLIETIMDQEWERLSLPERLWWLQQEDTPLGYALSDGVPAPLEDAWYQHITEKYC